MNFEEITSYFAGAVNDRLTVNDQAGVKSKMLWLNAEMKIPQADTHRMLAFCEEGARATDAQVTAMYDALDTFGDLWVAVARLWQQPDAQGWWSKPPLYYSLGWCNTVRKLTTPTDVVAFRAWIAVKAESFDLARDMLGSVESAQRTEVLDFVEALLYLRTERWPDAVAAAARFANPPFRDEWDVIDDQGRYLVPLALASRVIAGTAWAHLGNRDAASEQLQKVVADSHAGDYPSYPAEALRILGLMKRADGDEAAAVTLLNQAQGRADDPRIRDALADPSLVLTLTRADLIDQRTSYWNPASQPRLDAVEAIEASDERGHILREADEMLDRMYGMEEVKEQIGALRAGVRYRQELKKRGMEVPGRSNHLILTGPPGTGKTEIARVIQRLYTGLGVTRKTRDCFREVQRADLEAGYEGQTGEKTKKIIDEAMGGVLFIDEAYNLVQKRSGGEIDPFGQQIVEQLLIALENGRDDLVVIIAGYEEDIQRFLATNEGLSSRFNEYIQFRSYRPDELAQIARLLAARRKSQMTDEAVKLVESYVAQNISLAVDHTSGESLIDKLGNGRFMRNVVEEAEKMREVRLANHNLAQLDDAALTELTADDLALALDRKTAKYRLPAAGAATPTSPTVS